MQNGWSRFREKPNDSHDWINGGFFVVEPEVLDLVEGAGTRVRGRAARTLASRGQLAAYEHHGFWMPMDTIRERDELNRLWEPGNAPWRPAR